MTSAYPLGLDNFATNKNDATISATDHPAHHNNMADAINKIEAALGTDPAGFSSTVSERFQAHFEIQPEDFNANVGDGKTVGDGAITTGTAILTSATAGFTANDVGKVMWVVGAGASGNDLCTTIQSFTNATTVVLANNAGTTVSGAWFAYGTDSTTAIKTAVNVAASTTNLLGIGTVRLRPAIYMMRGSLDTSLGGNTLVPLPKPDPIDGGVFFYGYGGVAIEGPGSSVGAGWDKGLETVLMVARTGDTVSATNGPPSVIGAATSYGNTIWTFGTAKLTNLAIGGIDLMTCASAEVRNTLVWSGWKRWGQVSGPTPTHPWAFGFRWPYGTAGWVLGDNAYALSMGVGHVVGGSQHQCFREVLSHSGLQSFGLIGGSGHPATWEYVSLNHDGAGAGNAIAGWNEFAGAHSLPSPASALGTCTITIASPCVVTKTSHGLVAGDTVAFSGGTFPTGINANQTYFVIAAGLTASTFEISVTPGGSAVNTSGTQSGTHSIVAMPYYLMDANIDFEDDPGETHILDKNNQIRGRANVHRWGGLSITHDLVKVGGANFDVRHPHLPLLSTTRNSAPADGDLPKGGLVIWWDQTPGSTGVKYKGKDSAGTVVTGTL
jgi:hypothetical protein